jgi:hypothetical protein
MRCAVEKLRPCNFQTKEEGTEMKVATKAVETTGTIDAQRQLVLDEPLPVDGPTRVRVIILLPEEADIDEMEWLQAAVANPAFDFLKEPEEDIYTLADGRPFYDQG